MRCHVVCLLPVACLLLILAVSSHAEEDRSGPRAGWPGVFPELAGYQCTFLSPVVAPAEKPVIYRQTARYEWTGGAIKTLEATVARDPTFKEKHAAEALRKEKPAPKEIKIGKRIAWQWETSAGGGRLVVPLGEDRALILEAKGAGPWEPLPDLAGRFDLARIEAALAQAPAK